MNCNLIIKCLVLIFFVGCQSKTSNKTVLSNTGEDPVFQQMADAEILRNPDPRLLDFRDKPKWEYTNGLVCSAMMKVWEQTSDKKYFDYAQYYLDSMIQEDGHILTYKKSDYNIDRVNSGKVLMEVMKVAPKEKYEIALHQLIDQMKEHPKTSEGGFWHKKRYPSQMWLDGLYMGSPFLAQYAMEFNAPEFFDVVAQQVILIDKYTWVEEEGLYHHAWDESREQRWANSENGRAPHAWGRAMGWFAMAMVDILDYFPKDHPQFSEIKRIHQKLADSIIKHQHESGLWWQVLDQAGRDGNYLEASASSMFAYFLLKSYNNGYLSNSYGEAGLRAYNSILEKMVVKGAVSGISLTKICGVAGLGGNPYRDGSFDYYINEIIRDNDPKGVGPFIMAGIEYEKLRAL
ncbi:glycoside hydrolase family 88 protein [Persicobacter diffluens]|uniref:Family 88 glycosyl hydrolase n=1 Tax=Persicobacter diffluens TaxID=981 RepID=A0AAN5APV6_9BACT|nr:family 88 glycosyl hydrolase [Persicobacter diffluens]